MISLLLQVPVAVDTAATQATQEVVIEKFTLWELILKGGPIMIPIGILAVIAIYFFFERLFVIRKAASIDNNFMNKIRDLVLAGSIEGAKSMCMALDSPIARMIGKGISRLGKPVKDIEAAIENAGRLEVYKLERNIGVISTIAGLAPMFGFLGTIFGVIKIFYEIHLQNSLEIGTISGGLYVKMVSSAAGLLIGIIAYAGYQFLVQRLDRVVNKMEINAMDFIDLLEEPVK